MKDLWLKIKPFVLQIVLALIAGFGGVQVSQRCLPSPPATVNPISPMPPSVPQEAAAQPWEAIGKIQIGSYGCSISVVGPRLPDGSYDLVCAAHCLAPGFKTGTVRLDNGKQFSVTVMTRDTTSDVMWLRTSGDVGVLPFLLLADDLPQVGEAVWHGGFGTDKPRNKESGTVVNPIDGKMQTQYRISVSHGDSGGGIVCTQTGKLLSTVCCTSRIAAVGDVWGCSIKAIRETRPKSLVNSFEWTPIEIPTHGD